MNNPIDKALDDAMGDEDDLPKLNPMEIYKPPKQVVKVPPADHGQDTSDDYDYVRKTLQVTLAQSQEALRSVSEYTNAAPSPRAFEVMATLLKTNTDIANQLIQLQKTVKEIAESNNPTQKADVINNNQYNLTLTEALAQVKEAREAKDDEVI